MQLGTNSQSKRPAKVQNNLILTKLIYKIMKKFIANRIFNGDINTIIGTLDLINLTFTEEWYFNGRLTRKEIQYSTTQKQAMYDFDLACKVFSQDGTNLIHIN